MCITVLYCNRVKAWGGLKSPYVTKPVRSTSLDFFIERKVGKYWDIGLIEPLDSARGQHAR